MFFTALMTAYYTFRLYFRVFEGPLVVPIEAEEHHTEQQFAAAMAAPEPEDPTAIPISAAESPGPEMHDAQDAHAGHGHAHKAEPAVMILPLVILALGALFAGWLNFGGRDRTLGDFLGHSASFMQGYQSALHTYGGEPIAPALFGQSEQKFPIDPAFAEAEHDLHWYVAILSGVLAVVGILLAFYLHLLKRSKMTQIDATLAGPVKIIEAKFWVDEFYTAAVVRPLKFVGEVCKTVDTWVVDGAIWLITLIPQMSGFTLSKTTQRGYLQGYALSMLLGTVVILWIVFM